MLGLNSAISVCRPPNFFPRGWGGGPPTFGAEGDTKIFTKIFENLKIFEKFFLKNAIKMIFGDLLKKIFFELF